MDDSIQGMLFAGLGADPVVDDAVAQRELRLCALNVGSPNPARAHKIVQYLIETGTNVIVLTELKPSPGSEVIATSLATEGFHLTRATRWRDATFHTLLATKGFQAATVAPTFDDPRVAAADLTTGSTTIRLVGVYAPTNGMTPDSSSRRAVFQQQLLAHLAAIRTKALCIAGDLNVVEPDHRPPLSAFEPHDYDFYHGLLALGLTDAYRAIQPDGTDHSWYHPRYGSQRLDHALIGAVGQLRRCHYDHATRHHKLSDHTALHLVLELPE